MAKVNLVLLREVQKLAQEAMNIVVETRSILARQPLFCDECGEINPQSGFYPMEVYGPNSISGLICNDCDKKIRAKYINR